LREIQSAASDVAAKPAAALAGDEGAPVHAVGVQYQRSEPRAAA
jgi:hypothetical protein